MSSKYAENDLDEGCVKGFQISLSWDYPDNWCLKDVTDTVFFILDQKDSPRSESQFVNNCVQSSGTGVILTQPNIGTSVIPCELHFTAYANNQQFCITHIIIVSEAKHVELYLDDLYEKTSKGCLVTMKKGKKAALHENEFNLSSHVQGSHKISLKFLSLADKRSMRLQAIVVKVTDCSDIETPALNQPLSSMDMSKVKKIIQNMGMPVSSDAKKLIGDIEQQQKQRLSMQLANFSQFSSLASNPLVQAANLQQTNQLQATQNLLQLLQLQAVNPEQNVIATPLPSGHHPQSTQAIFPPSLFPVSRGNLEPFNNRVRHCKSLSSVDKFDGFGTPNPPNESVLINALCNREQTKRVAESRAEQISQQNHEQTQMEFVKHFLKSQETKFGALNKERISSIPMKGDLNKKRPHSLSALPSSSEMDFTNLLSNLIEEEKQIISDDNSESASNTRWETYLRSRIRASQRLSTSDSKDRTDTNHDNTAPFNGLTSSRVACKVCGGMSEEMYHDILQRIDASEKRIMDNVDGKLDTLRRHIDSRMDNLFASIYSFNGNCVLDEDYPPGQDTAV